MADYAFLTTWLLDAPREDVWREIYEVERWPEWWPGVELVERLREGDETGVGAVYRHRWRSTLPYAVGFDVELKRVEPPDVIEADARGELTGVGRWRMYAGRETAVTYEWRVRTTRPWMNAVAPVARAAFEWNHNAIMRRGGEGLARRLNARLLASS